MHAQVKQYLTVPTYAAHHSIRFNPYFGRWMQANAGWCVIVIYMHMFSYMLTF